MRPAGWVIIALNDRNEFGAVGCADCTGSIRNADQAIRAVRQTLPEECSSWKFAAYGLVENNEEATLENLERALDELGISAVSMAYIHDQLCQQFYDEIFVN